MDYHLVLHNMGDYKAKLSKPKIVETNSKKNDFEYYFEPISIEISGKMYNKKYKYFIKINTNVNGDLYFIQEEFLEIDRKQIFHLTLTKSNGDGTIKKDNEIYITTCTSSYLETAQPSTIEYNFKNYVTNWLFLFIDPDIAGIAQKINYVLPYSSDIKPKYANEIERRIYFVLEEQDSLEQIPSWLFSSDAIKVVKLFFEKGYGVDRITKWNDSFKEFKRVIKEICNKK